jgi:hypothetical protein
VDKHGPKDWKILNTSQNKYFIKNGWSYQESIVSDANLESYIIPGIMSEEELKIMGGFDDKKEKEVQPSTNNF